MQVGVLVDPVERRPRLGLELAHQLACRRSSARTRRAARRTAGSRRRRRSTASAAAPRRPSARRSASRAGSGRDPRRGSRRRGCPASAPSSRSVVAASSGVNGSACRLVKMLSRPNMVMNHGRPAAGRLVARPRSAARTAARRGRRGCGGRSSSSGPSRTRARAPSSIQRSRLALHVCGARGRSPRPYSAARAAPSAPAVDDVEVGRPLAAAARGWTVKVRPCSSICAGALAEIDGRALERLALRSPAPADPCRPGVV